MAKDTPRFQKNRLMRKLPALLLVAAVVISVSVWGTSARYVHQSQNEAVVKAKEFYFTSDYLVSGTKKYELNPGQTEVTIQLRNYDGLKVSELDVNYTVTVDEKSYSGTIPAGTATDVPITLNNLESGKDYVITATGSNGYTKTISAIFTVKNAKEGIYKHTEQYGDYVLLTIWTQGKAGNATVTIPSGLIPDHTNEALEGKVSGDTISVSLTADASVSFRFFTTGSYVKAPINVTAGEESLPETALN